MFTEHRRNSDWVHFEFCKTLQAELREQRRKLFSDPADELRPHRSWSWYDADIGKDLFFELRDRRNLASGTVESARPINTTVGFE